MDDDDVHLRRYAVEILNQVPDGRSVDPLIRALRDDDWWVRERSIDALANAADPRAAEPLMNLLLEDAQVAPLCARALGALASPVAIDTLIVALSSDPNDELSREAMAALKVIAKGDVPADVRSRLEEALRNHGIRLERTKLRPMTVQTAAPATDASMQYNPLERVERAPAPGFASPAGTPTGPPPVSGGTPRPTSSGSHALRPEDIDPDMVLLGRYRVIRKIGAGGFSTVFLVEDEVIADELILKILSHHLSEDEKMTMRFVQELKLARRISHKNVIRIHDLLEIGASRAISMEYFPGSDLGDLLDREEILQPARGIVVCKQICEGLAAAHEAGVTHRDIKPANVLIGQDDVVKIVDFGLASVGREVENRLTRTGHLVGTPHYMAPELIRGEEINAQADVYSFGIMMYEMFSGKLPYDGDNPMNVLFRHLDGDAPSLVDTREGFSPELSRIVAKAMQRDKDERYATAMEVFADLDRVEL
jgi:serine/threonine-protein kinase